MNAALLAELTAAFPLLDPATVRAAADAGAAASADLDTAIKIAGVWLAEHMPADAGLTFGDAAL